MSHIVNPFKAIYTTDVAAEELEKYVPGGYHPVLLHDRFNNDRYEILHKLGFGASGTVWLARDMLSNGNVALKVVVANESKEQSCRELRVLNHLACCARESKHPGSKFLPTLIDYFHIVGPNGKHLCLVTNLVGPPVSFVQEHCEDRRLTAKLALMVSKQLILALDFVHQCDIAHGDLHTGNVLLRYPKVDSLELQEIHEQLGEPETGTVSCVDGSPLPCNLPNYAVAEAEYHDFKSFPDFTEIQLIDFGGAFFKNEPPKTLITPKAFRPPELLFGIPSPLTQAVDIWSLGNTIFELVIGRPLFLVYKLALFPWVFQKVLEDLPDGWLSKAIENGVFTMDQVRSHENDMVYYFPLEQETEQAYGPPRNVHDEVNADCFTSKQLEILSSCLRKMLVLDPAKRSTCNMMLEEKWFNAENTVC